MGISLYDHQLEALGKMHNGCILCGGVGSGKSRTSLAYYAMTQGATLQPKYHIPKKCKDLYIITTARKRDTLEWEDELINFLMSTDPRLNQYPNFIKVDSWNNIQKYKEVKDAFFIFDEQRVVGTGVWVKSFLRISKFNDWILLSATPGDTWLDYIPVFIANGFFRTKSEFMQNHVKYAPWNGKYPRIAGFENEGRLIRLRKMLLVDMDFKRNTVPHVELVPVEYDVQKYKDVMKTRWNPYTDEPIDTAGALCYTLRRVVNSDISRQNAAYKICQERNRVIIFYSSNYEREILRKLFENRVLSDDFALAEWSGHCHEDVPKTQKWVYLVQYTAGCEGWNCIETDTILFYSQQYSYKVLQQASGRIDRLNTPFTDLYYYHLRSHAPIDLAIARALKSKKTFEESAFVSSLRS